jgi:hypothetical protein
MMFTALITMSITRAIVAPVKEEVRVRMGLQVRGGLILKGSGQAQAVIYQFLGSLGGRADGQ